MTDATLQLLTAWAQAERANNKVLASYGRQPATAEALDYVDALLEEVERLRAKLAQAQAAITIPDPRTLAPPALPLTASPSAPAPPPPARDDA